MTERILLIKHGALGDIIQGFDAFESLRKSFPDAHIALLTTKPYEILLKYYFQCFGLFGCFGDNFKFFGKHKKGFKSEG